MSGGSTTLVVAGGVATASASRPLVGRRAWCSPYLPAAIGLSAPLWCAVAGGAAFGVAVLHGGPPGPEAQPPLLPGGALLGAAPPAEPSLSPPSRLPRLMGLDTGSGGVPEPAPPASRTAELEPRARDRILVATAVGPAAMPDDALERIVGGQAAASDAVAGATSEAGADQDPQLDALNRVLVEKGGVLLPTWTLELQPELLYSHKSANGLLIVEQDGLRNVLAHDANISRLETAVTARLGLPWRSQAELRVPYLHVSEDTSDGLRSNDRSEAGLGDVELALARQFLREDGWLPDLVGEVRWRLPTGEDVFDGEGPAVGSGFHGVGGRVTLLKTYDPVVFLGSLGYSANLEDEKGGFDIDPGDTWSLNAAAILAAGPGVSMRTGFGLAFTDEAEVEGTEVAGSDKIEGVLSLGVGLTLTPSTLLDVGVGVGVTDDAPDATTRVALAYRF